MNRQVRRTLAAGFATTTALAALFPVFQGAHWFPRVFGMIAAVTVAGLVSRSLRLPRPLQVLVALLAWGGYLVLVFAPGTLHRLLPSAATADTLRALADAGRHDINTFAPPVPPSTGVVLLTVAGVGLVAVLVDLLAVVLDKVAVAGLPLLALFAVPSSVLPGGLGAVAFGVGASGWLTLLLEEGGDRVGRWGTPMRAALPGARPGGDDSSLGRVGRRIGAAALGLAILVPPLVPGLDHRLVGGSGNGAGGGGGGPSSATTYNPLTTLRDQLTLPHPRQLFVYTTDDPAPDYVRMTTLDTYTGNGWASSRLQADRDSARVQKGVPAPPGENPTTAHQSVHMRIAVDDKHLDVHWLPVPFGPRRIRVQGTWLWDPRSQTVFSAARTTAGLAPYTVGAERTLPTREALQAATGLSLDADIAAHYGTALQVAPEIEKYASRVVGTARTPYDEAVAIQQWFTDPRNGFVYDTSPSQPGPGEDALDAFLSGKRGFCEQYATAMAVLLRVRGIPSRVAVGFTPGQAVPGRTDTYSVTTSDAHAWPEAWFTGTGWVRFEPTPAALGATTPDYSLTPHSGPTGTPSARPTPHASANAFPRGFRDPDTLLRQPTASGPATSTTSHAVRWALLTLLAAVLLASPWVTTRRRRSLRARHPDPLVAWQQLQDDVYDVAAPWRASDSPRAAARRLAPMLDPAGRLALGRLATAAELARYAPPGRASSTGLLQDCTVVRRVLRASAPRRVRWRATVATPSTLRWASHLASERVADVLDLTDRAVSWVFRPFRRVLRLGATR